jgi:hypothetical protein
MTSTTAASIPRRTRHPSIVTSPLFHLLRAAPKDLRDYFRIAARRKVDKDRTVTLDGRLYEAPVGFMGQTVTLLYHADDPRRVEIWKDETSAGFLVPLDQAINSRVRRDKSLKAELEPTTPVWVGRPTHSLVPQRHAFLRRIVTHDRPYQCLWSVPRALHSALRIRHRPPSRDNRYRRSRLGQEYLAQLGPNR